MLSKSRLWPLPLSLVYGLAAGACLLAPFFVFLNFHHYPVFAAEVLPLYWVPLVAGLILALLVKLKLITLARLALWACLLVGIIYLHNPFTWTGTTALAAVCGLLVWKLRDNAPTVIIIAAALHIGSTFGLHALGISPTDRSTMTQIAASAEEVPNETSAGLPPVLHLVLDEFTGLRGLPRDIPGGQSLAEDLKNFYLENGFYLTSHAYSQYAGTYNSVPRLMNFSASDYQFEHISSNKTRNKWTVEVNDYFKYLTELGYALNVYQSAFMNFCRSRNTLVTSCSTYGHNSIKTIQDMDIPIAQKTRFIIEYYLYSSSELLRNFRKIYGEVRGGLGISLPAWRTGVRRTGPLAATDTVGELNSALRQLRPGEVHFAHLLLPHNPFILNADCSLKTRDGQWLRAPATPDTNGGLDAAERQLQYRQYFEQIQCTQNIINELFASIRASGQWERAIIIIHGDHGTRLGIGGKVQNLKIMTEDDFRDIHSAFFATKFGASEGALDPRPMPLQFLLSQAWWMPSPALDTDLWQLPVPKENSHYVYVYKNGWPGLEATPLKGFGPIEEL